MQILLVEDDLSLAEGLQKGLGREGFTVNHVSNGADAIHAVDINTPDIMTLDLGLPDLDGLDVLRQVGRVSPCTRVLILTMHDDEGYLREALSAGCAGYVLKRAADIELLSAIRAVHGGGTYLHAAHTQVLFEQRTKRKASQAPAIQTAPGTGR